MTGSRNRYKKPYVYSITVTARIHLYGEGDEIACIRITNRPNWKGLKSRVMKSKRCTYSPRRSCKNIAGMLYERHLGVDASASGTDRSRESIFVFKFFRRTYSPSLRDSKVYSELHGSSYCLWRQLPSLYRGSVSMSLFTATRHHKII